MLGTPGTGAPVQGRVSSVPGVVDGEVEDVLVSKREGEAEQREGKGREGISVSLVLLFWCAI